MSKDDNIIKGITNEEKKTGITKKKPTNIDKITKVEFKKRINE